MSNLAIHLYLSILNLHLEVHNEIILGLANLCTLIKFPLFGSYVSVVFLK